MKAIKNYQRAISFDPIKLECLYNLGNAMCNSGQYPEAIQYYIRTIALDKLHDPAYYNLGYVYHMTKQFQQAVQAYSIANKLAESFEGHFNLSQVYKDMSNN